MHQTKKGNQWHFGMKAHRGADAQAGLVHTVTGTAANVAAIAQPHELLHGEEKQVYAEAGYLGVGKRAEIVAQGKEVPWYGAAKRGKGKAMTEGKLKELTQACEKAKAPVRARVEHPFHLIKNLFKHRKARYRGLMKNTAQLQTLLALANLLIARGRRRSAART